MSKQNGPEILPAVDAANVQAKRNAEAFSEATQRAVAGATAFNEVLKRHRRKRAVIGLVIRFVVYIALTAAVCLLSRADWWEFWELGIFALCALNSWFAVWVGAWVQFMWCKEGVLR